MALNGDCGEVVRRALQALGEFLAGFCTSQGRSSFGRGAGAPFSYVVEGSSGTDNVGEE